MCSVHACSSGQAPHSHVHLDRLDCRLHIELKGQKNKAVEAKNRLDVALKDVRRLNRRIGELEQQAKLRNTSNALALTQRTARDGFHGAEKMQQENAELRAELTETKEQLQNATGNQVSLHASYLICEQF